MKIERKVRKYSGEESPIRCLAREEEAKYNKNSIDILSRRFVRIVLEIVMNVKIVYLFYGVAKHGNVYLHRNFIR